MERLNVAIADDNDRILELLGEIVNNDKDLALVGKASNGEEMYQIIKNKEPDVVLLDLIMPKMDGLSVMERVNEDKNIKKIQIIGCMVMSFMHGAQDGQKFIGILIIFLSIVKGLLIPKTIDPLENIWIILLVSILMFIGVCRGGKKIVENIGSDMVKIDNKQALLTDIATAITLLIASLIRFTCKYNTCKNNIYNRNK